MLAYASLLAFSHKSTADKHLRAGLMNGVASRLWLPDGVRQRLQPLLILFGLSGAA